jgi:hypothetical protein
MTAKPQHEVAHIIENIWDRICGSSRFNTHQIRMLNAVRVCRTAALGWHIDECDECNHLRISYNSCRNRHCPKCQGSQRESWITSQHRKLLPVKYFHVVFTIPDTLNKLCLYQAQMMYSILFKAAWQTINSFGHDAKHIGGQTGMTCILHTWGQNLSLHPHLHCIIPAGAINAHGKWKQARAQGKFLFPVKALSEVFRAKFVCLLRKKSTSKGLTIPQSLFDQLFEKNWIVFAKQPFLGSAQIIEYIGRYTHKIAISNHRIVKVDQQKVFFSYKDYRKGGDKKIMTLDKMEFIRRFSLHILPLRFVRIRHYGILNARSCHKIPDIIHAIHQSGAAENQNNQTSTIITLTTNNNQICPVCKKGRMLIVATGNGRSPPDINVIKRLQIAIKNSLV